MTGLSSLTQSLFLTPVEAWLAWYAWTRVRSVHGLAGGLIAVPSALSVGLVLVLFVGGLLAAAVLAALVWAGMEIDEAAMVGMLGLYFLGGLFVPVGHAVAVGSAGLGLGLLVGTIRGTELDEREAVEPGETLR